MYLEAIPDTPHERWCSSCRTTHPVSDGTVWQLPSLWRKQFAIMIDGRVYDLTPLAAPLNLAQAVRFGMHEPFGIPMTSTAPKKAGPGPRKKRRGRR